jgi:hypothetical protein
LGSITMRSSGEVIKPDYHIHGAAGMSLHGDSLGGYSARSPVGYSGNSRSRLPGARAEISEKEVASGEAELRRLTC